MTIRWLMGERTFFGLFPNIGLPFGEDELRAFWRENREWALAEARRRGLPVPAWEAKYARPQKN
jgi:hypothetical protein